MNKREDKKGERKMQVVGSQEGWKKEGESMKEKKESRSKRRKKVVWEKKGK